MRACSEAAPRKKGRPLLVLACAGALLLGGCESTSNTQIGGLVGSLAGGIVGSFFGAGSGRAVAVGVGGIVGYLVGRELGGKLDAAQQAEHERVYLEAMNQAEDGQTRSWNDPAGEASGAVTPTRSFSEQGARCREFTQVVTVEGEVSEDKGMACRQGDGTWRLIEAS